MILFGEVILLRALTASDNAMLLNLMNDPDTEAMVCGKAQPISEDEQRKWFERLEHTSDVQRYIIAEKETGIPVGTVVLTDIDYINGVAQLHIKLEKERGRGKGYGTDAVKTAVQYAFCELRLNCVYAEILEYNTASIRLFEKCGFQREGLLRSRVYKKGRYINVLSYSRIKDASCERNWK